LGIVGSEDEHCPYQGGQQGAFRSAYLLAEPHERSKAGDCSCYLLDLLGDVAEGAGPVGSTMAVHQEEYQVLDSVLQVFSPPGGRSSSSCLDVSP
jgi:hypothetical protein